ncbi:MAG: hypothetical protein L6461_13265 [Anaerolineae bacterium]|nr:hypothetical protein [Anaerolineae bacterium]
MPFRFSSKSIPFAFAVLVVLAYGLLVTRTGFYWDDWPFAWGAHFAGPESFLRSFLRVRPFLGPIFWLTTGLLPETPLAWQVFALVIRFSLTLSVWWALRNIWPDRPRQTLVAALVFLVYPGYSQHWVAFTHINQELIPLFFYILSFGATGWAFHDPARSRPRTVIALLLLTLGVFPTEYFVTLEPLRFLFLFAMLGAHPFLPRVWQALKLWVPYIAVWLLNAAWLFFYYRSGLYANYDLEVIGDVQASALDLLTGFFHASAEAVIKAGFVAYAQILSLVMDAFPTPSALLTLALIAVTFALLTFYLAHLSTFTESVSSASPIRLPASKSAPESAYIRDSATKSVPDSVSPIRLPVSKSIPESAYVRDSAIQSVPKSVFVRDSATKSVAQSVDFILIGLLGILLGRIPSWAAGLPLTLQSSFDRFNVSMMLAASLLAAGMIELIVRNARWRLIFVSLLVALGVGQQFYNANIFRRDWERQRDIYWQLAWRIPALQPGTVLFTDTLEIDYETDYSLTAPINWLYAPDLDSLQLPYLVFGVDMRPDRLALDPNTPIEFPFRPAHFSGNTSQSVAFLAPLRGCLRILSPGDQDAYQNLSERMQQAIALSNPNLISATTESDPFLRFSGSKSALASVFGPEPAHDWCYHYAKAELARQHADWDEIARLEALAAHLGLTPADPLEWIPFIEAGVWRGEFDLAVLRTHQVVAERPFLRKTLCAAWNRAGQQQSLPAGLLDEFGCQ